ncbi:hypothetical protein SH661x_003325 [Planctomicrobium sp. SH661]|uniref:hypothetical protein n=1 Tax=Planctomicrobium sp. SH661 TaxID=3448124 RepID=UPI003F5B6C17
MNHPSRLTFSVVLAAVLLLGCGGSPPSLRGTVTWNGQPIESGSIRFLSEPKENQPQSEVVCTINKGVYRSESGLHAGLGKNRVEVRGQMKTGKTIDVQQVDGPGKDVRTEKVELTRQFIPPEFNEESTLTRELKSGVNEINLELTGTELKP